MQKILRFVRRFFRFSANPRRSDYIRRPKRLIYPHARNDLRVEPYRGQRKGVRVYDIIPPNLEAISKELLGIKKYPSRASQIFGYSWRAAFYFFFILNILTGITPADFLRKSVTALIGDEQKSVNLYTTDCRTEDGAAGVWRNPENIGGGPSVLPENSQGVYSEENSAVYIGGIGSVVCGGFRRGDEGVEAVKGEKEGEMAEGVEWVEGEKREKEGEGAEGAEGVEGDDEFEGVEWVEGEKWDEGDKQFEGVDGIEGVEGKDEAEELGQVEVGEVEIIEVDMSSSIDVLPEEADNNGADLSEDVQQEIPSTENIEASGRPLVELITEEINAPETTPENEIEPEIEAAADPASEPPPAPAGFLEIIKDAFSVGSVDLINVIDGFKLLASAQIEAPVNPAVLGEFGSAKINFSFAQAASSTSEIVVEQIEGEQKSADESENVEEALIVTADAGIDVAEPIKDSEEELPDVQADVATIALAPEMNGQIIIWYSTDSASGTLENNESWTELASLPLPGQLECATVKNAADCFKQALVENINGGHFTFDAPFINNWQEAADLKIKFEGKLDGQAGATFFLDSIWLTVDYQPQELVDQLDNNNGYEPNDKLFVDNKEINFSNTDENSNENILIKTDSRVYDGVTSAQVYFSLTNVSDDPERVNLQIHFPGEAGSVKKIERLLEGAWVDEAAVDEPLPEPSLFEKASGKEIRKKPVPEKLKKKISTRGEGTLIGAGRAQFYKMEIVYPRGSSGEFYIEAVGDNQGYGLLDPWWNSSWLYKIPITINNTGNSSTLTDYQVLVEIASTTSAFWNHVKTDGSDIRFLNSSETTQLNYWIQYWDKAASSSQIWVQVDSIPASSDSTIYLYYGNGSAATSSNMYNTFSYSAMQDLYYVVSDNLSGASVAVVSLIDSNTVQLDSQTSVNLNRQAITTFSSPAATSVLRAKGPVMAKITGIVNADALVPISFAGTAFAVPQITGTESWGRYAPFVGATTTIYNGTTLGSTAYLAAGAAGTIAYNITTNGRMLSTNPVLLSHWSSTPGYSIIPYPASLRDLYGIRSNNNYVGFTGNTNFSIYCSSGSSANVTGQTVSALYTNTTCANGNDGTGNAVRLSLQTNPIGSIQLNDSDGVEATTFLPDVEFSTEYMVPTDTAYLSIACAPKYGTVNLSVYSEIGAFLGSGSCTPSGNSPGKAYFGAADALTYNAGARIISTNDQPFYVYYEDVTAPGTGGQKGGDEGNLWGAVQARKRALVEPGLSIGAESGLPMTVTGKVYSDEGINPLLTSPVIAIVVGGSLVATTTASSTDGSYSLESSIPSAGGSFLVFIASSTISGATYNRYSGSGNVAGMDIYQNRVIVRHDDAGPISNSDINNYDGDQNSQIKVSVSGSNLTASSSQMLYIWPGAEYRPGGIVTLSPSAATSSPGGDIKIASSTSNFNPQTNAVSVGGDWLNLGTFSDGAGQTVTFTATSTGYTINNGSSNFTNLTFNGSGGGWSFSSSTILDGNLTVTNGALSGTGNLTVNGGGATGAGNINFSGGTFTIDGTGTFGGDTNWSFNNLIFGDGAGAATTSKTGSGSITASSTLTINANQYLNASSSTWILTGSGAPLVINGSLIPQTSIFRYTSSSNVQPALATYYRLELSPAAAGSPTYTIPNGTLTAMDYLLIGNGVNPVTVTAAVNNSILDINGNFTIGTSSVFNAAGSASFTVAGNWTNFGIFNHSSGTVTFDAGATGRTVDAGGSPFYDIIFNNNSGGWTVANASSTHDWTLTSGTFIAASGATIEVAGVFTNGLANASTTWTGATLYLNGTSQTINSKLNSGDSYNILKLGDNTQAAMWNSTSSVYIIPASGSLYSMDHNNVDGALYIWGNYQKNSGTDYWSWQTDFDGTDLTGSERQVNVRLAANATTTYSGGNLNIIGTSTAVTTIDNQGAGNYALVINNGSLNATNYQIRNINSSGLRLAGTSIVTSLDGGDFLLQTNGGSMITVDAATVDQSSGLTITGDNFASSTGITAGYNVSLIGLPSSYWTFTAATGNLAGESFDNEAAGTCGRIRWDDSSCAQVTQSHYRWRNDDGDEAAASWKAAEDAPITAQSKNENVRLRFSVASVGGEAANNYNYRLYYADKESYEDCASVPAGNFSAVPTSTIANPAVVMSTSTNFSDQATTSRQLTPVGTFMAGYQVQRPSNETSLLSLPSGFFSEAEYNLQFTDQANSLQSFCLKLTNRTFELTNYDQFAEVRIVGPQVSGFAQENDIGTVWTGCDGSTKNLSLAVNGNVIATTSCALGSGAFSFLDVALAADVPVSVFLNTNGGNLDQGVAVTKTLDYFSNLVLSPRKNRVWLKTETGVAEITNSNLAHCDSVAPAACANVPYAVSGGNLTIEPEIKLVIGEDMTFRPGGTVTLEPGAAPAAAGGDLLIDLGATLNMETNDMYVGGDWLNTGTFSAEPAEIVTFTATSTGFSINPGASNFSSVTFNGNGGGWSFAADIIINNDLAVASGTLSGTNNISVQGGDIAGNGIINLTGGTLTLSGDGLFGSNQNWTFDSLTFGDGATASTTEKVGSGGIIVNNTLTIAALQTLDAYETDWTLTAAGSPFVITGNLTAASSTFIFSASAATEIPTTDFYRLTLAPAAGSPTYTIATGTLVVADELTVGNGVNSVTVTAFTNDSVLDINGDLTIATSSIFTAAGLSAFTVAGNWTNTGTFNHSNATTTFDADTTGRTISAGGSSFFNIDFNNPAGGWTIISNATSTNNWNLTAAADFTATTSITLEINGRFTNNIANASTTWTGTTLYLNGTSQTINSKTGTYDYYDTLAVGANTDIRMWNSIADTYQIDSSGSLYSMNHGNVAGHLYIWGDYHVGASQTDYWNYATDYDGTSLTGSEREAYTYIASSSTVTVDGGTLNLVGTVTVSSKVDNQGSGLYSLNVSSGILNAKYYRVRNLDENGLNFSGSPIVTSLDYGNYELAVQGGSLITVTPDVLAANPSKIISGCVFATSTGITAGYNVSLTAAAAHSWNFVSFSGGLSGEDYDTDPGDPDGYILWSNIWEANWRYVIPITIDNTANPNSLTDYQALVEIASTTVNFWRHVAADGADIRFANNDKSVPLNFWLQYWDKAASSTQIWVQVDSIPAAATTTIYLYYGNSSASSTSDMYATFSYSTMQDLYYVVSSNLSGASVEVVSLIDGNTVQLDSQTAVNLNRQATTTFSSPSATSVLRAKGPVMAKISGIANADALVPVSFAGTAFVVPQVTGTESWGRYAPFVDATTSIYNGNTLTDTNSIPVNTALTTVRNINSTGRMLSTAPVLLSHWSSSPGYSIISYPATMRDLYGIRSNNNYVGFTGNTDFSIYCSSGSSANVTGQTTGGRYTNTTCASGNEGVGNAVRLTAQTNPIGAIQLNDSDGAEATSFLPDIELSTEYMVPTDTQYVTIACPPKYGSNVLEAYTPTGTFITSTTCSPGSDTPAQAYFGSATDGINLANGTRIVSADGKPFYAYYEDAQVAGGLTAGDEGNLWGAVQARKGALAEPGYSLGAEISGDYIVSGAVYSDDGQNPLLSGPEINLAINGTLVASTSASTVDGSFQFIDLPKQGAGIVHTVFIASSTLSGVAFDRYVGSGNIMNLDIYQNMVIVRHDDTGPISNGDIDKYDGDQEAQILATVTTGNLSVAASERLYIWPGTEFRPGGTVTLEPGAATAGIGGDLLIASSTSIFNPESYDVYIGGDWQNLGTFSAAAAQITTFTATSTGFSIEPGASNFSSVTFNGNGGGWSFATDIIINNDLAVASGTLSGTNNISVQGGDIAGNGIINLTGGTLTLSGDGLFGSNQNWTFDSLTFGDGATASTTEKVGSGGIIINNIMTIAALQTLNAYETDWTLTAAGSPFVITGNLTAASSTFIFSASAATEIPAADFYRLTLAPTAAGSPTYTIATGTLVVADELTVGNGVNSVTVTANSNNSILDINGNLTIATSSDFIAPNSASFTVGGSWNNSGVFNNSGGSVTFDASSTGHIISAGGSVFNNILFNNSAGGWTIAGNATSSNNWLLTAAADFTVANNVILEINGFFTNNIDNASTTWTGSTLYLNGLDQTINSKNSVFDHYGTLKIGQNTDIRMWNSSADSYDVDSTGSLYSMNHGNVSGHLYVWGNYYIGVGQTDYWSGATDYDGSPLAGAEREAYTYIAANSVIAVDGGTLNIIGSSTVSSKIANQGSGTFTWQVGSGILNANYFQVKNTDFDGLNLSGSPVITSLDNGDFELSVDGGNSITVSASVIDTNPNKTISGNIFSSTVGTTTEHNVNLSGTPASLWTFTAHSGNLAGEAYDSDAGDPRGYIIWDDSPYALPRSQHWRWYQDQATSTPIVPAADEITAPSGIALGNILKLRMTLQEINGVPGNNVKMRLQYSTFSDFSSDVNYVTEIGVSTSSAWSYADGIDVDNEPITLLRLSDSVVPATHNESGISVSSFDIGANTATEWEFTVLNNNGLAGSTYYFRAYTDNLPTGAILINDGETYPSIVAGTSTMASAVAGVPADTEVEDVFTDITTDATSIPFGTIVLGQPREGAQQFSVSTNGEGGYQLFVYQRQNLMNQHGSIINPVAATNDNPLNWPASPDPAAFGYHTSDENLSGLAPSRFAPNDSYARLETTMREIGYSSTPVQNDILNLVYKLEVNAATQSPGEYQSELVYIMVPTY